LGRKPRIEYIGGVYHTIQRGNNREYIFQGNENKEYLLGLIKEYKTKMNFELLGYVFMDNHYHLIVKTLSAPLQEIMHRINNKFSKYYNFINGRTGHVFESRYKGILVKNDGYILSLLRYVHQNPVRAKLCKKVSDYKWSSDSCYRQNKHSGIVDIDLLLSIFSQDRAAAVKEYIKFMDAGEMEEVSTFEDAVFIGDEGSDDACPGVKIKSGNRRSLDEILLEVTKEKAIYEKIKTGSRKRHLTYYKREYIHQALNANYTMEEIGKNIGISAAAVFKMSWS
jgi:putative transposase